MLKNCRFARRETGPASCMVPDRGLGVRKYAARILACMTLLAGLLFLPPQASAQFLVAVVNGDPITIRDVEQRSRIIQASTQRTPNRKDVIQELVDERLKLHQARRLSISVATSDVERAFATMAQRAGATVANFEGMLAKFGVEAKALKAKIRADLAWREVMQAISPGAFQVREADLVAAMMARGELKRAKAVQYRLREFVFVVPRSASAAARAARMREAEALRTKFGDCDGDLHLAREYSEVVVQDPVFRISTDLPDRLQQLLAKTPDGRMTPPETTNAGISVVAVCGRRDTVADLSAQSEIREQLLASRVAGEEKQILERLRRQAIIEYR
jgi:peptidyl-prolyl cis-trans isomerase SurA